MGVKKTCELLFDLIGLSLSLCVCGHTVSMNEAEVDSAGNGKCVVMLVDSLSCGVQLTKIRFTRLLISSALTLLRCGLL